MATFIIPVEKIKSSGKGLNAQRRSKNGGKFCLNKAAGYCFKHILVFNVF
jgi:hypothetical protein